jgi:signal transduction histidine kinase/streptogramin lyase
MNLAGESFEPAAGGAALPADARFHAWSPPGGGGPRLVEFEAGSPGPRFALQLPPPGNYAFFNRGQAVLENEAWVGSRLGLFRIGGGQAQRLVFEDASGGPDVSCLCAGLDGGVWFGTEEDGLHYLQRRLVTVHSPGSPDAIVASVAAGPDGSVWAATREGLFRGDGDVWRRLDGGKHRSVAVTPGGVGVSGLLYAGPNTVLIHRASGQPAADFLAYPFASPNTLWTDSSGSVWVCCERGVTRIDAQWLASQTQGRGLPEDASNFRCWTRKDGLPDATPMGVLHDREGSLWVGSHGGGLVRLRGDLVERFGKTNGLASSDCAPRHQDGAGSLWIVGDAGITRYRDGQFCLVSEEHGLPENTISDLLEDDAGWFWLAGRKGIHGVERRALDAVCAGLTNHLSVVTLGLGDGMRTPECSSEALPAMARTPDGRVWVATPRGLASFDPREVRRLHDPPAVVIEQIVINRNPQWPPAAVWSGSTRSGGAPGTGLALPAGSGRQVEVRYAAIAPSHPQRVLFRHRLEGYDGEWSAETDLRQAVYANLKPGRYMFRVKACNHQGTWTEDDAALAFSIAPYYWQTPWFVGGLGLAVAAILLALHRTRVRGLRQLQELRHRQQFADERARIAADMHDDLGSALTQIAIMGEVAGTGLRDQDPARTALQQISQSARDVTSRMSEIVWATNPRNDTLDNLVAHLREYAARHFEPTPGRGRLDFPDAVPGAHVSATFRRNLLLILKESLNNASKHAAATCVEVRLRIGEGRLQLTVADNGRGFVGSPRAGGMGLPGMRKRAAALDGSLAIRSEAGQGTSIHLDVPVP